MTFTIASTYLAILLLCIVILISANDHIPQFSDNTLQDSNNTYEENVEIFEDLDDDDDEEVGGSAEELVPSEVSKTRIKATLTLTERMKSHFYILSQQNSRNSTSW
jgi:hypothetical protein